jgi:hypothetical protein
MDHPDSIISNIEKSENDKKKYQNGKNYIDTVAQLEKLQSEYSEVVKKNNTDKLVLKKTLDELPPLPNTEQKTRLKKAIDLLTRISEIEDNTDFDKNDEYKTNLDKELLLLDDYKKKLATHKEEIDRIKEFEKCYKCPSCEVFLRLKEKQLVIFSSIDENVDIKHSLHIVAETQKKIEHLEKSIDSLKKLITITERKYCEYTDLFDKFESLNFDEDLISVDFFIEKIKFWENTEREYRQLNFQIEKIESDPLEKKLFSEIQKYKTSRVLQRFDEQPRVIPKQ